MFSLTGNNFLSSVECFRNHAAECRGRPAGVSADAHHHYWRDRPVGRIDDGPGGRGDGWLVAGRSSAARGCDNRCPWLIGLLGGALNAVMVARYRFPPLIVTLGTFSLFRGMAEGLTRGIENYSGFSPRFLFLGQGYIGGVIPTQFLVLVVAVAGFAWWLHHTESGRSLLRHRLFG